MQRSYRCRTALLHLHCEATTRPCGKKLNDLAISQVLSIFLDPTNRFEGLFPCFGPERTLRPTTAFRQKLRWRCTWYDISASHGTKTLKRKYSLSFSSSIFKFEASFLFDLRTYKRGRLNTYGPTQKFAACPYRMRDYPPYAHLSVTFNLSSAPFSSSVSPSHLEPALL